MPSQPVAWKNPEAGTRRRAEQLYQQLDLLQHLRQQSAPRTTAGFDPARDIQGITVNRWAHGYAFLSQPLFDPDWKEEEKTWVLGRKLFGRITIANSDSAAEAETDAAIDQAYRAVHEIREI